MLTCHAWWGDWLCGERPDRTHGVRGALRVDPPHCHYCCQRFPKWGSAISQVSWLGPEARRKGMHPLSPQNITDEIILKENFTAKICTEHSRGNITAGWFMSFLTSALGRVCGDKVWYAYALAASTGKKTFPTCARGRTPHFPALCKRHPKLCTLGKRLEPKTLLVPIELRK